MKTYWMSFRLAEDTDRYYRYQQLLEAIRTATHRWWTEPTSFIVFSSNLDIDTLADRCRNAINASADLVVIGMSDYKTARIVGSFEDADIFELMPFMKQA